MTHPTKGEPVAGTATPLTDAQEEKVWESTPTLGKLADIVPAHFARSLETQLTLAREKIAAQEKELTDARDKVKDREGMIRHLEHQVKIRIQDVDTARASLAAVQDFIRRQWQPISTAPKDGTNFLIFTTERGISTGQMYREAVGYSAEKDAQEWREYWTDFTVGDWGMEEYRELNPTHWMPLPEPPKP